MGGKDKDMVSALLTLPSPYSRRYRYTLHSNQNIILIYTNWICSDDITVEVIFFGESTDDRSVSVNKEASAVAEPVQSKL
jgi:pyruvate dehydrogenase phosphatase